MKRIQSAIAISFLCAITFLSACGKEEEPVDLNDRYGVVTKHLALGKAAEGNHYYVIYESSMDPYGNIPKTVPSIYVLDIHMVGRMETLDQSEEGNRSVRSVGPLDQFLVDVYGIETDELIRTIDVKKLLEEKYPNLQPSRSILDTLSWEGMPCLVMWVEDRPENVEDKKKNTERRLGINLETEELYELESEIRGAVSPMERKYAIFTDTSLLKENGICKEIYFEGAIFGLSNWEGTCVISILLDLLPEKDVGIYQVFPDLKEKAEEAKKQGGKLWVDMYLTGNPSEEEVMRLLIPEDQEISFENVYISEYDSKDGKEHKVDSFEEYQSYLKEWKEDDRWWSPIFKRIPS